MDEKLDPMAPVGTPKPHHVEPPKKVWWFLRDNGEKVPVSEIEAWHILRGNNAYHRTLKLVGVSSGVTFQQAVREAHKAQNIEESQRILREAHESEYQSGLGNIENPRNQEVFTIDERQGSRRSA